MKNINILGFLRKTTISKRLLFLFLIQTTFIILWCSLIVKKSLQDHENTIRIHNSRLISSLSYSIEQANKELFMASKLPIYQFTRGNSQIFDILHSKEDDNFEYSELYGIRDDISTILDAYNNVSSVYVSDLNGFMIYGKEDIIDYQISNIDIDSTLFQDTINNKGALTIFTEEDLPIQGLETPKHYLLGSRSIMQLNPLKSIGAIFIFMDITKPIESFQIGRYYPEQKVSILDNNGNIIYGNLDLDAYEILISTPKDKQVANLTSTRLKLDNSDYIYHYVQTDSGFLVVSQIPYSRIISDANKQQMGLYLLILFLIISVIIITKLLVESINQPVHILMDACNNISNEHLMIEIDDNANDEIHSLIVAFNAMSRKIQFLIEEVYQKDILQAQTELQMLRSQINPHFMYNTLETIRASAVAAGNDKISQISLLLGKTLRYGVSSPSEPVTLKREINNLHDYIQLQNIYFQGRLDFHVSIEDELQGCIVIKLLLQPLVENSIYHGFAFNESPGTIEVYGFTNGKELILKVIDNGVGIETNKLNLLNDYVNNKNDQFNSIGLKNVNRRIKLYYGNEYGIAIDSVFGRGTIITVNIPYNKGRT